MAREVKLPSGALLKVNAAPFADSKALYQALLKEGRGVSFGNDIEMVKSMFIIGFCSPVVEAAMWKCMERCTYNTTGANLKITPDSFEKEEARKDFVDICYEVGYENVSPFFQSLLQLSKSLPKKLEDSLLLK